MGSSQIGSDGMIFSTKDVFICFVFLFKCRIICTPAKTNMSAENQWLEDVFPIEMVPFLGTC